MFLGNDQTKKLYEHPLKPADLTVIQSLYSMPYYYLQVQ